MFKVLDGKNDSLDRLPEVIETNDIINCKYAPINSVDVELSFTIYIG